MTKLNWNKNHCTSINLRLADAIKTFSSTYKYRSEVHIGGIPKIISNFWSAIEYSLVGGKRVRGLLVIAAAQAAREENLNKSLEAETDKDQQFFKLVIDAAAAIECTHAFSLVHDDMPCMDNDELRRGRPTCHIKFGQATALLVGDALQTLGVQILTSGEEIESKRFMLIKKLAMASGANGMAGGQAVDIGVVGQQINLSELEFMHSMKTGALLELAVEMGLIIGSNKNRNNINSLKLTSFGKLLGLAFQVVDDILDATGTEEYLGKKVGRDSDLQKPNFVQLMGIKRAQEYADKLLESALKSIEMIDASADPLRMLAENLTHRKN